MPDKDIFLILKKHWGYSGFRPIQEDIINHIIQKKDALVLLPTGGGKSLCFQIPGLYFNKTTLVISPLVALMQDQVNDLVKKNISAIFLQGHIENNELQIFKNKLMNHEYRFVYMSPERLASKNFQELLQNVQFGLIAIDEAHCISQFGHDFRPAYLQLHILKSMYPQVPILALTASATLQVQEDIFKYLFFKNVTIFQGDFLRKNLSYSCFNETVKMNKIIQILKSVTGSAIVYCATQNKTEICCNMLVRSHFKADFYHAGLSLESRTTKLKNWLDDDASIMVCTNAFGMGINKPNVRCVLHHDIPNSPENYYQEAGRAGRDNKNAFAVLVYNPEDLKALITKKNDLNVSRKQLQDLSEKLFRFTKEHPAVLNFAQFAKANKISLETIQILLLHLENRHYIKPLDKSSKPDKIKIIISVDAYNRLVVPDYEFYPILSCLVKLVSHVFNAHVNLPILQMSTMMSLPVKEIQNKLEILHDNKIIDYIKNTQNIELEWLCNEIPASGFMFNEDLLVARQKVNEQQIQGMLSYINLASQSCRTRYLANYFGQYIAQDCQICDLCLERKNQAEKQKLYDECWQILQQTAGKQFKIADLTKDYSSSKKKLLSSFFKEMVDKKILEIGENDYLKLNKDSKQ